MINGTCTDERMCNGCFAGTGCENEKIKVIDCGRDVLQKILIDHLAQGYEIISIMFIERYINETTHIVHTMFTVVFKR